ncbi:MAG: hypothetical protein NTU62_16865 [Spirochaetes bacterium]|nr:hypothetical protein [Spirochaetota bacterium]
MRRRPIAAACLALLALAGCARSGTGRAAGRPEVDPDARFFQLAGGIFDRVAGPSGFKRRSPRPWTVQERIADLAFVGDTLWLAVNSHGLASVVPGDPPSFAARYDDWLFPYRTITTLVPGQGSLTCHLYYNATLNTAARESLKAEGISFLRFEIGIDDYVVLLPPFQRRNPEWEAVGVAPLANGEFLVEWKLAADETSFAWTRFVPLTLAEAPSTREAYRQALASSPADGAAVSGGVRLLFDACLAELAAKGVRAGGTVTVLFVVREQNAALKHTFRTGTGDAFVTVPVFLATEAGRALLPDGRVVSLGADGTKDVLELPALPSGFRYTDLARSGGHLVVPWEEVRFPDVGAAGVLFYRLPAEK